MVIFTWLSEISIVSLNMLKITFSEHGGIVKEPSYLKYFFKFSCEGTIQSNSNFWINATTDMWLIKI
jgi:hypothetical protein